MARRTEGSLWAWGNNDYWQLGNPTITSFAFPTLIPVARCVLSNEQFEKSKISIYPNPSNSTLTIINLENINEINIYNTLGQLLQTKT